jgi:hypothetical protein
MAAAVVGQQGRVSPDIYSAVVQRDIVCQLHNVLRNSSLLFYMTVSVELRSVLQVAGMHAIAAGP